MFSSANKINRDQNKLFIELFYLILFFNEKPDLFNKFVLPLQAFLTDLESLTFLNLNTYHSKIQKIYHLLHCACMEKSYPPKDN